MKINAILRSESDSGFIPLLFVNIVFPITRISSTSLKSIISLRVHILNCIYMILKKETFE